MASEIIYPTMRIKDGPFASNSQHPTASGYHG